MIQTSSSAINHRETLPRRGRRQAVGGYLTTEPSLIAAKILTNMTVPYSHHRYRHCYRLSPLLPSLSSHEEWSVTLAIRQFHGTVVDRSADKNVTHSFGKGQLRCRESWCGSYRESGVMRVNWTTYISNSKQVCRTTTPLFRNPSEPQTTYCPSRPYRPRTNSPQS